MRSPFRYNKKERRRWRKAARDIINPTAREEWEKMPGTVEVSKRLAGHYTRIAHAKRKKPRALKVDALMLRWTSTQAPV